MAMSFSISASLNDGANFPLYDSTHFGKSVHFGFAVF